MQYTYTELITYLFLYGFIGWALEAAYVAVKERRFRNRGFFNLPICPEYGVMMDILIILLPTLETHYVLQFLACLTVVSVVEYLAGGLSKRIWRKKLWKYENRTLFSGEKKGLFVGLAKAGAVMAAVLLVHPVVFWLISMVPKPALQIACAVIAALLAADFLSILYAVHKSRTNEELEKAEKLRQKEKQDAQKRLGDRICQIIWKRLDKAYPDMEKMEDGKGEKPVFAKGVCLDKLIWVFIICAFLGDLIETVFCRITGGVWMSRSSVVWGPFSIVWGLAIALVTQLLYRYKDKPASWLFVTGTLLGGAYEYLCSVFTEVVFGAVFWDYSAIPFNLGGRINLLYCFFWGFAAVAWFKVLYPPISAAIEKLPRRFGTVLTWALCVFMAADMVVSSAALVRYNNRLNGVPAANSIETYLDEHYDNDRMYKVYPKAVHTG